MKQQDQRQEAGEELTNKGHRGGPFHAGSESCGRPAPTHKESTNIHLKAQYI